jgi:hypothetical protein
MFRILKKATKSLHDWLFPWCDICHAHASSHHHCSLCNSISSLNCLESLRQNLKQFDTQDQEVDSAAWVCEKCFKAREKAICCKTHQVFFAREDRMSDFDQSKMQNNLDPYHPDSELTGSLSPEGFLLVEVEHEAVQERISQWAGGTKQETLRGYRIEKEIGIVRCNSHCDDPADVEHFLMWYSAQVGGNGFIKFFWDKHIDHHQEEYVAGHGANGNPYYRTRRWTTQYFTGHAVAVIAEPLEPRQRKKKIHSSK